jgi:hypothetical protein
MKTTLLIVITLGFVACIDYSNQATSNDADAGTGAGVQATDAEPNACQSRSYRGGAPGEVACPGTPKCGCSGPDVCCLATTDALGGACTALGECRALAFACDGPEDCSDGGVCCLEDRRGGGSSCKAPAGCAGQWLCRTDGDCAQSAAGPRCMPLDLGTAGVDDRGLDSIVGTCGR